MDLGEVVRRLRGAPGTRIGLTIARANRAAFELMMYAESALHLRVDLTDEDGQAQYHSLDDALVFVVYPSDDARGLVRLEGRWSREDSALAAELEGA